MSIVEIKCTPAHCGGREILRLLLRIQERLHAHVHYCQAVEICCWHIIISEVVGDRHKFAVPIEHHMF